MKPSVFALTGVTGHLGRHVFFEIIKDYIENLENLEIYILGRSSSSHTLSQRIEEIFLDDGIDYFDLDNPSSVISFFYQNVHYINIDLSSDQLIDDTERQKLVGKQIDSFFHIAASTDFRDNPKTRESLYTTNVKGTSNILELVSGLSVTEFSYVSTAYACGETFGEIQPDYTNLEQKFRNPYEKTKLEGELLVRSFKQRSGIRCRIFRPSTICGRLIENKKGAINKFDVFYGWAAFFLRLKIKNTANTKDIYNELFEANLEIAINKSAGLNIVSADFAAKILYQVCKQNIEGDYFHLVNDEETPHDFYLGGLLEALNIYGFSFTSNKPTNLNRLEEFYYKTIGSIFSGYIEQKPILFNTDNLKGLYKKLNLYCPPIDSDNFKHLVSYAKSQNFGIPITKRRDKKIQV